MPLPSESVVTRLGTWFLYNEHFTAIKSIVKDFDTAEYRAVCQEKSI